MNEKYFGQIISRKKAKEIGSDFYFTGKPCSKGHYSIKRTKWKTCIACEKSVENQNRIKKWQEDNKDRVKGYKESHRERNPDYKKEYDKNYYRKNKEEISRKNREYYYNNREKTLEYAKNWYFNNREWVLDKAKERRESPESRAKRTAYLKEKYDNDPSYRMRMRMREMINRQLKHFNEKKKGRLTEDMVGYSSSTLVKHIEDRMLEGMSWENYGEWHIDHIKPIRLFVSEGVSDPSIVNDLSNLCCMWSAHNLSKGDKTLGEWLDTKNSDSEEWNLYSQYL